MTPTWHGENASHFSARLSIFGWLRVARRGFFLILLVVVCFILLLTIRLIERPIFGLNRPITPWITQFVCRNAFRILGISFRVHGELMCERGAVVANHSSWLDIFALNARNRIYFVSKSEVASWFGIGWLARATGTVFIDRDPQKARQQKALFEMRLAANHKLLFFPEGTSTDGLRVLPFKTTLFAAFFSNNVQSDLFIQPTVINYFAPNGASAHFYGWWSTMGFGEHLLKTLAQKKQGSIEVTYLPPIRVADYSDRKALAKVLENMVRDTHLASGEKVQIGA
ncbi:MAG: lysophospholipid acyltransferase family protein [Aestuariivita sp.]|nr:lysophospholipid acyltransferase family protein [Aestuariivita sp.]